MAIADMFKWKLMPLLLLEGPQPLRLPRPSIHAYLPTELLREIFLYCIESNQTKPGQLASVCGHWSTVIAKISYLWSTLRVGTWTEREQVAIWLQRANPKRVLIDTERDDQTLSNTPFSALQDALANTSKWQGLTISSFPPETLASQLGFQSARPMSALKTLHVAAGCVNSSSFTRLLDLVPTEAPVSELRLHPPFASTHFLQPHWLPVLQNLTVLIVNGRDIDDPFELLPAFTQLQIFEADRLRLPSYEPNANLSLLYTLRKLQLKACSVQWMAGRDFLCLEECAILLPRDWEAVQRNEVQLPSCKKLIFHGYPMTTVQYFHVPKMRAMELKSHDSKKQRVYQQLYQLCTLDGRISRLTTLHLTLQCSEQVFLKVLKCMGPLQKLILSVAYPSRFWPKFLKSLAAKPSTKGWPEYWGFGQDAYQRWEEWCASQTWHSNVLPHLKFLGIHCPRDFSRSECRDNFPLFRLVGWTRRHLTPPLEHLKVWEGRETTDEFMVDYISTRYLDRYFGKSSEIDDWMIVIGMATQRLVIYNFATPLLQLHSSALFRLLEDLEIHCDDNLVNPLMHHLDTPLLPCLEQIKRLEIRNRIIPAYSLDIYLPLVRTLQSLKLVCSTFSWMLGRTFKTLKELEVDGPPAGVENQSRHEGFQVDLSACITLKLEDCPVDDLRFLSCPNVQILNLGQLRIWPSINQAVLKSLRDFLRNCPCLQKLEIRISHCLGLDSLNQFVFRSAREQGVWQDIRSVEVRVLFSSEESPSFTEMVGHRQDYEKWWNEFTFIEERSRSMVIVRASM